MSNDQTKSETATTTKGDPKQPKARFECADYGERYEAAERVVLQESGRA